MGLEAATFISELNAANPLGADDYATADDHLRLIKSVLQSQFPNFTAVLLGATQAELDTLDGFTGTLADHNILSGAAAAGLTATELLFLNGVTSAIQAQIDGKAPTAHSHTGAEISDLDAADVTTGIFAAARIAAHTGDVTGLTALAIANDAVTYAKMQNIVNDERLLGNIAGPGAIVAELTQAQVLTFLAIEAGATADQTAGEIEGVVNHDNLLGFLGAEHVDWAAAGAENLGTARSANGVLALTAGEVAQLANIGGTVISLADWVALAALLGVNTGDQTITLTGNVTGSGQGSFAATIANNAVTLAKMADMATASFLGRNTAATGDPEVLSATIARAILNVENGATADQSNAEIKTAYEANANTNEFDDTEQSKLAGIETAATADQTAAEIEAIVNHDNLLGFVLGEHILHTGVVLTAGTGLSGGGAIDVSRTFNLDISALATLAGTLVAAGDGALIDDAGVMKRINYRNAGTPVIDDTTTSRTLVDDDMNSYLSMDNAAATSVVLNTGVGEKGNMLVVEQHGAGQITVSGTATINAANGLKTAKQFSVIVLFARATDNWVLHGDSAT